MPAKPFLKWVGGKGQLSDQVTGLAPKTIQTYFEPFVGGGAVFFALAAQQRFERAVLNDFNAELMDAFKVVRDFPDELLTEVKSYPITKEFYLDLRAQRPMSLSPVQRAARTLYLNKTGFNGLYRVNKQGGFNTPWGYYKKPTIADPANIQACAKALAHVALVSMDFEKAVGEAKPGDLVYFDPPYVEVSNTANFTSYTSVGFTMDDQKRLAECFKMLAKRGVAVIASNSDTPPVRELYEGWEMNEVQARRAINSNPKKRGPVGELIIVGRRS